MIEYNEDLQKIMNELMSYPNANCVYRHKKITNNKQTDIDCLCVGVDKKIIKSELSESDIIPEMIYGIKTDILELPIPTINSCFGGQCVDNPQNKFRPLKSGVSAIIVGSTACTLGAIVKDALDNSLVGLTNNHCAGDLYDPAFGFFSGGSTNTTGILALQPSPFDGGKAPQDVFGSVKRAEPSRIIGGVNIIDAAIYELNTPPDIGTINIANNEPPLFASNIDSYIGQTVKKNGRTTCWTEGVVFDTNATSNVRFDSSTLVQYQNLILIRPTTQTTFLAGGDSGSVCLTNDNKILGLNFASISSFPCGFVSPGSAYACRIDKVQQILNIKPWQGDIVVANNSSPTITVNGRLYVRYEDTFDPITHTIS